MAPYILLLIPSLEKAAPQEHETLSPFDNHCTNPRDQVGGTQVAGRQDSKAQGSSGPHSLPSGAGAAPP